MLRERLSCGERAQHRGSKLDAANDAPAAAQQLQGQKHSEGSRQAVLQCHTSESAPLNSSSSTTTSQLQQTPHHAPFG